MEYKRAPFACIQPMYNMSLARAKNPITSGDCALILPRSQPLDVGPFTRSPREPEFSGNEH